MIQASNTITTRFEVLRGGGVFATLEPYGAPEVECVTSSALKMGLRGTFFAPEKKSADTEETVSYSAVVSMPSGASYGFVLNSDGYYESTNAGVASSASVARIDLSGDEAWVLTLECTVSGETSWDYGLVYNLDETPDMGSDPGDTYLEKITSTTKTVEVTVPAGEHFLYVKYRKDSSNDTDYDKMTFRILDMPESVVAPDPNINWLTDRIRPVLILNGVEHYMGVYVVTTASEQITDAGRLLDIEGYSVLYLAQRTRLEETLWFAAGANYIAAVQELLQLAGITDYAADATDLTFATEREWEMGTEVLEIINTLLAEINYNTAWVDQAGTVRLTKYAAPSHENILHTYTAGEASILFRDTTSATDYFGKANVFRCICSNPDLSTPLVAETENSASDSPFSTANMGRVLHLEYVDNVPDLATLQERAENLLTKSLQTTEEIVFTTAPDPGHGTFDTIAFDNGEVTGIFTETEWRLVLDASGVMTHRAKRVIIA